jgi:Ca2+-binding EF-hand superfamily protein
MQQSFDAVFLPIYDADRNRKWSLAELQQAVLQEHRLRNLYYQTRITEPRAEDLIRGKTDEMGPEERLILIARLLKTADANHNAWLDPEEVNRCHAYVRLQEQLARESLHPMAANDSMFMTPKRRQDSVKTALELYDWDKNSSLSFTELRQAIMLETAFTFAFLPAPAPNEQPTYVIPLPSQKKQQWLVRCLPLYDRNKNGRWEEEEILRFCREEPLWNQLVRQEAKAFDRNQDGWLDPEERRQAAAARIPEGDVNRNRRLDYPELRAWVKTGETIDWVLAGTGGRIQDRIQVKAWLTRLFDFNQDKYLDVEEAALARELVMLCYPGRGTFSLPSLDPEPDVMKRCENQLAQWRRKQDLDGNGVLNLEEAIQALEIECLLRDMRIRSPSAWDQDGDGKASPAEWDQLLAELQQNRDADGDGRLNQAELRKAGRILWGEEDLLARTLPPGAANYKTTGQRREELKKWIPAFDQNSNGKLDVQELDQIIALFACFDLWSFDLHPEFDQNKNRLIEPEELKTACRFFAAKYDDNHDGILDRSELKALDLAKRQELEAVHEKKRQAAAVELRRQVEIKRAAKWLIKYDFNGNGLLDPEERERAIKDSKAGIQAPAQDE